MAGEPVCTHRPCPCLIVPPPRPPRFFTELSITFPGDKGPLGSPGPKGTLLLLRHPHHCLSPRNPARTPASESGGVCESSF